MLVIPDNAKARKVPNVEGMIVYRKDNNKVYIQGDKKLNALAEEKKVNKGKNQILRFFIFYTHSISYVNTP